MSVELSFADKLDLVYKLYQSDLDGKITNAVPDNCGQVKGVKIPVINRTIAIETPRINVGVTKGENDSLEIIAKCASKIKGNPICDVCPLSEGIKYFL